MGQKEMSITEIEINCAHDKIVPAEELVPNPRNPNTHSAAQVELLAKIIRHRGWRAPITVSSFRGTGD
jgi:ParB-like chromosome segregation protein Spo0J